MKYRQLKKVLATVLSVVMLCSLVAVVPAPIQAADDTRFLDGIDMSGAFVGNYVDPDSDYLTYLHDKYSGTTDFAVSTPGELAAIAEFVNNGGGDFSGKTIRLNNDVDLGGSGLTFAKNPASGGTSYTLEISGTAQNVWQPIGSSDTTPFRGDFDGQGYEVRNMVVLEKSASSDVYAGFFGYVDGGSISNLGIGTGSYVAVSTSSSSSAAVAAAGGIAGYSSSSSSINNSYNTGLVSSFSSSNAYAGGIAGRSSSSSINNSYNTGSVSSSSSAVAAAGGIAGYSSSNANQGLKLALKISKK